MAIDGTANRVYEVTPKALPEGPGNPVGNAWRVEEVLIEDETQAGARPTRSPGGTGRSSTITSSTPSASLSPTSWCPRHAIAPFAHPRQRRRAQGGLHQQPAVGDRLRPRRDVRDEVYPNQSEGGGGLPAYVTSGRNLVDTDVVLWFTFGTNHVVHPEDWPVMPVHPIGFRLLPAGFFAGNPALDIPPPAAHCQRWLR